MRVAAVHVAAAFAVLALGCGGDDHVASPNGMGGAATSHVGGAAAVECHTTAPASCTEPSPHYQANIKPIVDKLCLSCHQGMPDGPGTLNGYEHLANWHDLLRAAMLACTMPPPDSGITMTTAERQLMLEWLRCGFPE